MRDRACPAGCCTCLVRTACMLCSRSQPTTRPVAAKLTPLPHHTHHTSPARAPLVNSSDVQAARRSHAAGALRAVPGPRPACRRSPTRPTTPRQCAPCCRHCCSCCLRSSSLGRVFAQRHAQHARQLRQDLRVGDGLAALIVLDDLRLLIDELHRGSTSAPRARQ